MEVKLKPIKKLEVTTVIDNYADLILQGREDTVRRPLFREGKVNAPLLAEHGLSLFIQIHHEGRTLRVLLDTGLTETGTLYNMAHLDLPLDKTDYLVLSHGHFDHFGALYQVYERNIVPRRAPFLCHPWAFHQRGVKRENRLFPFPRLDRKRLEDMGVKIMEEAGPTLLEEVLLVTGEIPRKTDFEIGFPMGYVEINGQIQQDALLDDQALVVHVEGKGLVVISGCGHSGIINTVNYARELTGTEEVYGVIGGFHLSGPVYEPYIQKTVDAMKAINPKLLVPTHCTGFEAEMAFAQQMPQAFVLNAVGTTFVM
ncbi:MAG TPA: MBL fold metallo-hydrolase [Thermosulfidibacter takaii]|uniref:MBL fold metallo-hydrolase n=1 Tax=Thermosulfidibacter takaii TaxID=412593 RepID=A0A7C0U6Y3_9BACT|nr:MBL fold metallo-hydrolase [Thermosulfidibacter takaii]